MVKINGIEAEPVLDKQNMKNLTPSINEVLERMDNNFKQKTAVNNVSTMNAYSNEQNSNNGLDGNLLMSILPLMISNKSKGKGFDNPIFKEIIKKTNNPMLQKFFEILPKLKVATAVKEESKKEEVKIDSYVKTDEYK